MNLKIVAPALLALVLPSCHEIESFPNDPRGNFEQLWTILDEHYCFFEQKDVDWEDVHRRYSPLISDNMTSQELFEVCSDMLAELRDGHTNLSAGFATSYYKKWWSDYPQNFDLRLVQQHYFNFHYRQLGAIIYGILPQNIGYLYYPSFTAEIGDGNLDAILGYLATCGGLIVDVRDNGGGSMTNAETLTRRFLTRRILAGSISHKTGPGHNDFSKPFPYYFDPVGSDHITWAKPTVVLCNRSTFSAANNFVSIMKTFPNVTVVGSTTGGGSGMPISSEIICGWGVRFSGSPVRDPLGQLTEFGVDPSDGCHVDLDPQAALLGHDTMLDFAISKLQ